MPSQVNFQKIQKQQLAVPSASDGSGRGWGGPRSTTPCSDVSVGRLSQKFKFVGEAVTSIRSSAHCTCRNTAG